MAVDIAPELIAEIKQAFNYQRNSNYIIRSLETKVEKGLATYEDANKYAKELGNILAKVFKNKISSSVLPDGKMYYNIAERLLNETIGPNVTSINQVCESVQESMNKSQGLGIKAKTPEFNQDRIDGLIDKVSDADVYDDVAWTLDEPIVNLHQSVVDDFVEANVQLHADLGLKPVVTRTIVGNCCDWCRNLAGTYMYPDVPREVFQRHERCRCEVTYSGNRLGAYTSKGGKKNTFRR